MPNQTNLLTSVLPVVEMVPLYAAPNQYGSAAIKEINDKHQENMFVQ